MSDINKLKGKIESLKASLKSASKKAKPAIQSQLDELEIELSELEKASSNDETDQPVIDSRISEVNRAIVDKAITEFLAGKAISVSQSVDHCKSYREAIEVFQANEIDHAPLDSDPVNDETGFKLVQSWFARLGFKEIMSSEAIYQNQVAIAKASFKKASNTNAKLRGYLSSLTFDQCEALSDSDTMLLLKASLFLRSSSSGTGSKSSKKSGFIVTINDESKRPSFKATSDRTVMLTLIGQAGTYKHEDIEKAYQAGREANGPVGTSTYSQQYNKFKSVLRDCGFATITDTDV
jgi:hypothetical protein